MGSIGASVSSGSRVAAWAIVIALVIVSLFVAAVLIAPGADAGVQLIREGNGEDVREAVKLLIDAYASLVALVSAAFGVIAFLVTFQQSRGGTLTARAFGILFAAVVLLVGALILAFVGRETLLSMVTHNAVDITWPVLSIARWASYACTVLAAALTVWFAMEAFGGANAGNCQPVDIVLDSEEDI
jgi:hypothetical protein